MKQRKRKNICRLLIIGGALLCFACIAYWISAVDAPALDTAIRRQVYGLRSRLLNAVFIPITYMGNWQTITVLALVLLLLPGTRREIGVPFAVISIASTAVYKLVKEIFHRPRPELAVRLIEQGGVELDGAKVTDVNASVAAGQLSGDGVTIKKGKKVFHRAVMG